MRFHGFKPRGGENVDQVLSIAYDIPVTEMEKITKQFKGSLAGKKALYIKVLAPNVQKGFLFVD